MNIIEVQSVSKVYGDRAAVSGFSLNVAQGERIALLGPSGCGKTTVLRLLAGLAVPDSGRILIDGAAVATEGRNLREPEERNLGMVFQDLALWPHLTVRGNLEFGLKARRVPAGERRHKVRKMLERVRMAPYLNAKPATLSGGQQQRVALARALVLEPRVLLMDEPLSSLDIELNVRLRREILKLQGALGFALLYVTHDREEAFDMGVRVIVMSGGRMAWAGSVEDARDYFATTSPTP